MVQNRVRADPSWSQANWMKRQTAWSPCRDLRASKVKWLAQGHKELLAEWDRKPRSFMPYPISFSWSSCLHLFSIFYWFRYMPPQLTQFLFTPDTCQNQNENKNKQTKKSGSLLFSLHTLSLSLSFDVLLAGDCSASGLAFVALDFVLASKNN